MKREIKRDKVSYRTVIGNRRLDEFLTAEEQRNI